MLLRACCDGFPEEECEEVAGAEKAQEARARAFVGVEETSVRPQMRPEPHAHRYVPEPLDLEDIDLGPATPEDSPSTGVRVSKGRSRGVSARNLQRKVAFQSESPKSGGTETTAPTARSSTSQLSDSDAEFAGEAARHESSRFTKYKGLYEASGWRFQTTLDCGRITVDPWGRVTGELRFRCLKAPEHVPEMVGRLGVEYFEGHWSRDTQTILAKGVWVSDAELLRVTWSYVFFFSADCVRGAIDGKKLHLPVWSRLPPVGLPPSGSQSGSQPSSPSAGRSQKATEPMAPQMKPKVVPAATRPAPAPLVMPVTPVPLVKPTAPNKLPPDMDWTRMGQVRKDFPEMARPQPAALSAEAWSEAPSSPKWAGGMELLYYDAPFNNNTLASVKLDKELPIPAPIVPRLASTRMRAGSSSPRHRRTKAFWDRGD